MSPSSKHARDAARARAERQAAKRAAALRRKRRIQAGVAGGVALLLALFGGLYAGGVFDKTKKASDTLSEPTPSSAPGTCSYTKTAGPTKDVGLPPATPSSTKVDATIKLSQGTLKATLDGVAAPCTTNALTYLAGKKFFDATPCHRLTTMNIYVLQCGDPSGKGTGGPGFRYKDENLTGLGTAAGAQALYPAGTIAMANSGANTNGSQFFLVYKDSPLNASYTPVGMITSGLDVLQAIGKAGTPSATGDGPPKTPVTLETFTVG